MKRTMMRMMVESRETTTSETTPKTAMTQRHCDPQRHGRRLSSSRVSRCSRYSSRWRWRFSSRCSSSYSSFRLNNSNLSSYQLKPKSSRNKVEVNHSRDQPSSRPSNRLFHHQTFQSTSMFRLPAFHLPT